MIRKFVPVVMLAVAGVFAVSCDSAAKRIDNGDSASSSTNAQTANTAVDASAVDGQSGTPVFSFEKEVHDFGTINEGEVVNTTFEFTNTGDAPLIITNAKGSCGCTVPKYSKEPIAPGATGEILVSFNSSGKPGNQRKQVTLTANTTPNTKVLNISATVTPKTQQAAPVAE